MPPGQVSAASVSSTSGLIAEVRQRVETDNFEIRVYQGKKRVQLPRFMELVVITPLSGTAGTIEDLAGKSVAIVPSEKRANTWGVYIFSSVSFLHRNRGLIREALYDPSQQRQGRLGAAEVLSGNVFVVKQVLISSRRSPVALRLDGRLIQLKSGDVLLVL
jgi:hypothetical protein